MAKDLWVLMNPKYLRIFGDFCPRGGIAIKPLVEKWNDQISNEEKAAVKDLTEIWDRKR
jgi:NADPH-dependent 7-cyano-7-deazaguanine reductase QueF